MDAKYRKRSDLKTQVMLHNNEAGRLVSFSLCNFIHLKEIHTHWFGSSAKKKLLTKIRRSRTLWGRNANAMACPARVHCAPVGVNCLYFVTWQLDWKKSSTELQRSFQVCGDIISHRKVFHSTDIEKFCCLSGTHIQVTTARPSFPKWPASSHRVEKIWSIRKNRLIIAILIEWPARWEQLDVYATAPHQVWKVASSCAVDVATIRARQRPASIAIAVSNGVVKSPAKSALSKSMSTPAVKIFSMSFGSDLFYFV